MYRVLRPFEYFEPATVGEAVEVLSTYNGKATVLAGGMDLIPRLRRREMSADCLVSIQRIPGLDRLRGDQVKGLTIAALASLRAVEMSPVVAQHYLPLYEAVRQIASLQVKSNGTLVGNLCVATPASDVATALLALGARVRIAGDGVQRELPLEEFFIGPRLSALAQQEIVTEVLIPAVPSGFGAAFLNLSKIKADIAKVNVAVGLTMADGVCLEARIATGAVAPTPLRCREAESALRGQKVTKLTARRAADTVALVCSPISDIRSVADYRYEMVRVLTRRAIEKAAERAKA